jgi:hypothetical protein
MIKTSLKLYIKFDSLTENGPGMIVDIVLFWQMGSDMQARGEVCLSAGLSEVAVYCVYSSMDSGLNGKDGWLVRFVDL